MTNKQSSEQCVYMFKVGELFLKSHLSSGVEFTKYESQAYKISLYTDDRDEDKAVAKEHIGNMYEKLISLGFKDFVINKKTVKNEVSERAVTLTELQGEDVDDNDNGDSVNITFNISSVNGDVSSAERISQRISEALRRNKGII